MGKSVYVPVTATGSQENLMRWYEQGNHEHGAWYTNAHMECCAVARRVRLPAHVLIGTVAALSPNISWDQNIPAAVTLIDGLHAGLAPEDIKIGSYPKARQTAAAIVRSWQVAPHLSGPKVCNFAACLMDPRSPVHVTIDTWQARAWLDDAPGGTLQFSAGLYKRMARDHRACAKRAGLLPLEFQAVVWEAIRSH